MPGFTPRQLCHWGPVVAITLMLTVILSASYSAAQLYGLPTVPWLTIPHFVEIYFESGWILYLYYKALLGPGYVPPGWKPEVASDTRFLQFCTFCNGYKAPRSHHCRSCGGCVKKMDHHCPWINVCVGHDNHTSFIGYLFFLTVGCIHAVAINATFLYRLFRYDFKIYPPTLPINMQLLFLNICGIAFSVGAALGVLVLLVVQLRTVLLNMTQIESWIVEKAVSRRKGKSLAPFVYPYDVGRWNNFTQVVKFSLAPEGDGLSWPVRKGCNQYTFTIEQLEQKKEKRKYAIVCQAVSDFSGSRCSLSQGFSVFLCTPCMDPVIPINEGDTITITRWRTHWAYGDKDLTEAEVSEGKRVRGWVPRKLLEMVESPQTTVISDCPKKDQSADGNRGDRTEQNHSTHNKSGDGRNVANSSVASKDGKKKKKKAHHKKHD